MYILTIIIPFTFLTTHLKFTLGKAIPLDPRGDLKWSTNNLNLVVNNHKNLDVNGGANMVYRQSTSKWAVWTRYRIKWLLETYLDMTQLMASETLFASPRFQWPFSSCIIPDPYRYLAELTYPMGDIDQ